ncbi:23S rRNA (uracil(1939)-C(5))-methyltransferase RlmD [candidate division KSB1 bacterium]|nr:MAG: 23S rRNA (uracil(1939)-C(5))-methyltransferase RlmD [candidate division KSB1 bacterium]
MGQSYKKGDILTLSVDALAFGGYGVARDNDFVWFVEKGIPGQKVEARITSVKKNYGKSYVTEVISKSPYQVEPKCAMFGICGGCQLQHLDYNKQTEEKGRQVKELIERIGKFNNVDIKECIPAKVVYGYRNKMEFSFSSRPWIRHGSEKEIPDFALGLHAPRRFDKIIDLENCPLISDTANTVFLSIKNEVINSGLAPYDAVTHKGFWRNLVIRQGFNTDELMINIVTTSQDLENNKNTVTQIFDKIALQQSKITTLIHSINDGVADIATGNIKKIYKGSGKITEKINNRIFEISPNSFFQTNTMQTEMLFDVIKKLAGLSGSQTVYDLYCGTGAIGICLADTANQVLGIEIVRDAVENGARNVELNNLDNVYFVLADMKEAMSDIYKVVDKYGMADVVILDPPRGGTHPKSVKGLLNLLPEKIVYVSCNPAILARDIEILCKDHYDLKVVQPVDMFPHTKHIEVVALFQKK